MHQLLAPLLCVTVLMLAGCDSGHSHSHDHGHSHEHQSPAPQQPADHHKTID